ncbi:MAG: prepilin-type N-terminal cleavage/methylation domain-containing protein [Ideonella sp.]|nr:prepilin-type N-terminal cleavage/methylation domain-containing protein [Ideonella sp.]
MTPHIRHVARPLNRGRGVSLIEALVAMAVMAFGMLAIMGVQTTLHINADVAKQRTEATRIAEEEIEQLRTFREVAAVAGAPLGWDEVVERLGTNVSLPGDHSNASFTLNRRVVTPAGSSQKAIAVEVTWQDRLGNAQSVVLGDTLAAAAPVLSGLASLVPTRTAAAQRRSRHPTIPVRAHDMGNGESAFKPVEGGTVAWTFNNTTGVITSVCTVLAGQTSDLLNAGDVVVGVNCTATKAQLLAGLVRFNLRGVTTDLNNGTSAFKPIAAGTLNFAPVVHASPWVTPFPAPADVANEASYALAASDSENPRWPALPLGVLAGITSGNRPVPSDQCYSNAPATSIVAAAQVAVEYFCVVYPDTTANATKTWNGRPVLVPGSYLDDGSGAAWLVGNAAGTYRVCRYTLAASDVTTNTDHPLDYLNVRGNLINQNFLVVHGAKACPTDVAANPGAGDFVNSNTRQHQP